MLAISVLLIFGIIKGSIARGIETNKKRETDPNNSQKQIDNVNAKPEDNRNDKSFGYFLLAVGSLMIIGVVISAFEKIESWLMGAVFWGALGVSFIGAGYNLIKGRHSGRTQR